MANENYLIRIKLLSDTLIGGAEGYGAIIDKDSVFDEVGLPVIPGKRFKGLMKEQSRLLEENGYLENTTDNLFGTSGRTIITTDYIFVSNFFLPDYIANKTYLQFLMQQGELFRSDIINYFTTVRMMTSIDATGIAKDTSLRTIRILKKGLEFQGEVNFDNNDLEDIMNILHLVRRIGYMRNRGLGHIRCMLYNNDGSIIKSKKMAAI